MDGFESLIVVVNAVLSLTVVNIVKKRRKSMILQHGVVNDGC
jgi:hypothetical protein